MTQKQIDLFVKRSNDLNTEEKSLVVAQLNPWQAIHYREIRDNCGQYFGDLYLDIARGLSSHSAA